jgi:hypothetical protein
MRKPQDVIGRGESDRLEENDVAVCQIIQIRRTVEPFSAVKLCECGEQFVSAGLDHSVVIDIEPEIQFRRIACRQIEFPSDRITGSHREMRRGSIHNKIRDLTHGIKQREHENYA